MTEIPTEQQIFEYWNKARKVLIALPKNPTVDHLCAATALQLILQKMDKQAEIASPSEQSAIIATVGNLDFLPQPLAIKSQLTGQDVLVVTLNTTTAKLDELSYQADGGAVKIFLKPKDGVFGANDVSVTLGGAAYDLIITVGAQSMENFEKLYQDNAQLFFDTPKINFDRNPANEYFGTINVIDVTVSALSELVARIVDSMEPGIVDEHIATVLMAGIISHTHSFQDVATTPQTLSIAARLISQGARQQDIIKTLYKTKDFALLKLWGRALARIKTANNGTFLYSFLTQSDFEKTNISIESLPAVFSELIDNVAGFQVMALLGEGTDGITLLLAGLPHTDITTIARTINPEFSKITLPGGVHLYEAVSLVLPGIALDEAEQRLLSAMN